MGMFDYLRCEYPLPGDAEKDWVFQTKDTPAQWMDEYRIDGHGQLWGEEYDIEDRSDPNAEGIMAIAGCMTRVNRRPVKCDNFTGEIRFYAFKNEPEQTGWLEFSAYIKDGKVQQINCIEDRE